MISNCTSEASTLHRKGKKTLTPFYCLINSFYQQNTDEECLHSDSFIHSTEKKWHWHSYADKNNTLNSQTKSTRGNDFQMPEENVSNWNSERILTHASQVLQGLPHLFSDFTHTHTHTHTHTQTYQLPHLFSDFTHTHTLISYAKASSILEIEETNIFI